MEAHGIRGEGQRRVRLASIPVGPTLERIAVRHALGSALGLVVRREGRGPSGVEGEIPAEADREQHDRGGGDQADLPEARLRGLAALRRDALALPLHGLGEEVACARVEVGQVPGEGRLGALHDGRLLQEQTFRAVLAVPEQRRLLELGARRQELAFVGDEGSDARPQAQQRLVHQGDDGRPVGGQARDEQAAPDQFLYEPVLFRRLRHLLQGDGAAEGGAGGVVHRDQFAQHLRQGLPDVHVEAGRDLFGAPGDAP